MPFGLRRRLRDGGGSHRADPPVRHDIPAPYEPAPYGSAPYDPARYRSALAAEALGNRTEADGSALAAALAVPHLFATPQAALGDPAPPVAAALGQRRPMRQAEALAELSALSRG